MDPVENFEHQLLLLNGLATAHLLRCADRAGILDDDARGSLSAHVEGLAKAAEATEEDAVLAWLDTFVRTLPPLR